MMAMVRSRPARRLVNCPHSRISNTRGSSSSHRPVPSIEIDLVSRHGAGTDPSGISGAWAEALPAWENATGATPSAGHQRGD